MPETGKTPIQHYRTSTAAAVPLAGNLADGEIAINRADNKIFAKNSAGAVVELAGTTNLGTAVVTTNSRSITSSTGDDITVPVVTTAVAGFMSHTDKSKLDLVADNANNYSLPEATTTVRGGIELFSDTDQSVAANAVTTTASRTYGLQLNSAGQGVVNVPWEGAGAVEAPDPSTIPLRTATGALKVANAVNADEAVALGQLGTPLLTKVVEIGNWNMDTNPTKVVAHGIADFRKIRSVSAMIRGDNDLWYSSLVRHSSSETMGDSQSAISGYEDNLSLYRITGGPFDDPFYSSTSYNRGYVVIQYEP